MEEMKKLSTIHSIKLFGINCWKASNIAAISRSSPCINQLLSNSFFTDIPHSSLAEIERRIRNLNQNARRNGHVSLQEVERVIKEINLNRSASSTQSATVIRYCGDFLSEESPEKRTQLVQEVWNTLEKLGVALNIDHYNVLLKVYLENEHQWVPTEMLAELEQKCLQPNAVTYQCLVSRYCQLADIEGATRILQFMREEEIPINEALFNDLILGHLRANDMESAEGVLNVVKQADQNPSPKTYTLLACGYVDLGNLAKLECILEECVKSVIPLSAKDYLDIVYHMSLKDFDIDELLSKIQRYAPYDQEPVNCVYKLVRAGKIEHAYKIMKSMVRPIRWDGTLSPIGGFFVSALVRNERPVEEIIKYCDKLVEEELNLHALSIAMENSLRNEKESLAYELFRVAKERNMPLRTHYFWPLIVTRGKANDINGVYKVLSSMNVEFNVPFCMETVRNYVIPFILKKETNIPSLILDLKSCGVSTSTVVSAIVINLVISGRIREGAEIASAYRANYPVFLIRRPLVNSYLKTADADSFTTLLKQIAAGIQWCATRQQKSADEGDEEKSLVHEYRVLVGEIVLDVVKELKYRNECKIEVEEILRFLVEKGVGLGSRAAEEIQNQLQNELTQEISTLLEKLTVEDSTALESATIGTNSGTEISLANLSDDTLLRMYGNVKAKKGKVSKFIRKRLFNLYARKHELEKLLELKEEMEKDKFVFTNGMYAGLIDSFVEHKKLDDAWQVFQSRCEENPDFTMYSSTMIRLAFLAVKNEQYDKAYEVLSRKVEKDQTLKNTTATATGALSRRIVNHFADRGDVENVKSYFDLIVNNGYCTVNNILLGPLIRVHLVNNDLESALREFENCCIKHRATPFKDKLAILCIESENASGLQRLTDLSTKIHGKMNTRRDLMFSFLELGRLRQVKEILETASLPIVQAWLQNVCQKYQNNQYIEHLVNLLAVTKNIRSINRSDLYYDLLLAYEKAGEPQNAMSLWLQLQEEDEMPTDRFLVLLAQILRKHNMSIPFTVPAIDKSAPLVQRARVSRTFRKLLNDDKINEAMELKNSNKPQELNDTDLSLLLEALMKHERYDEARQFYKELRSRGASRLFKVLKYLSIKATNKGDVELLENIRSRLIGHKFDARLEFDNRLGRAYMKSGRTDEYLNKLENELDSINSLVEMEGFVKRFPAGMLFLLLQQSPKFLPRVEKIAYKCLEKNTQNTKPISVVWMHYLIKKNYNEAEKLWCNYLQNSLQPISFDGPCKRAVEEGNVEFLQVLKGFIERKVETSPESSAIIYSSLIEVLVSQDKVSDAMQVLKDGASKSQVENIKRNALEKLKAACVSRDIPFNYTIPALQRTSGNNLRSSNDNNAADSDSDLVYCRS